MGQVELHQEVIGCSESDSWLGARKEWFLEELHWSKTLEYCACGHPIKELCFIRNRHNGRELLVGNCCVNQFGDFGNLFPPKRTIEEGGSFNPELIRSAYFAGAINDWEFVFYEDNHRRKNRSGKQLSVRRQINQKILIWLRKE
jgi:hypothetical protein